MPETLPETLDRHRHLWEKNYLRLLDKTSFRHTPAGLQQAIVYSLEAGGKRLRPVMALESARQNRVEKKSALLVATALECLHTYSLVHDDLPSMDNDELRRGKPTCHIKFGEDVAILCGDALQSLAFELLSASGLPLAALGLFADAVGPAGMVGGQYLDIKGSLQNSQHYLADLHNRKTGRLIEAAVALPYFFFASPAQIRQVRKWGLDTGLLFQITDDILDVTATAAELGKSAGKDQKQKKITFVSLYGLSEAREKARLLASRLQRQARKIFPDSVFYQNLPQYILQRSK